MPDALEDLIGNAVTEAGLAEPDEFGELVATDETPDTPTTPETEEAATPAVEGEEAPAVETTPEVPGTPSQPVEDELDKELQELGIQSKDGQGRESRIRYGRVRKMLDNQKKKLTAELTGTHAKSSGELRTQIQQRDERLQHVDATNRIIVQNPGFYLQTLMSVRPEYKQAILDLASQMGGGGTVQPGQQPAKPGADDPMPQPDASYPDGTPGYSLKGLEARDAWNRRQAVREVEGRFDQKYGQPLERINQENRMSAERTLHQNRVQANVNRAQEVYGQLFTDDFGTLGNIKKDSAVMAMMQRHTDPQTGQCSISFQDACAMALIPKLQADRNKVREDVIEEIRKRPAAAKRSTPAAQVSSTPTAPQNLEDVIAGEMRKHNMM
jgi:hypothetical protein